MFDLWMSDPRPGKKMTTIETQLSEMASDISEQRKSPKLAVAKFFLSVIFLLKILPKFKNRPSNASKIQTHVRDEEIDWSDTVIYTALFGDYDNFIPPSKNSLKNIKRFIVFTDQDLKFNTGDKLQIIKLDIKDINGKHANRCIKMNPHVFLGPHKFSLYIDANIWLHSPPSALFHDIPEDASAIFFAHPDRGDVLSEILYCLYCSRISLFEFYSLKDFINTNDVASHPLFEANIILRRNSTAAQRQGSLWWELYQKYPYRDQFLLFQSLTMSGLKFQTRNTQNGNSRINRFAVKSGHKR